MEGLDISHLSEEEQNILRGVFKRQQDEENREEEIFRKCQEEVQLLEAAILLRRREKRFDLQSTCHICAKTKFADGVGHACHQCEIRCCARCGVKVQLRHNKIWLCILCRKKKELAIKFGKWLKNDPKKAAAAGWGRSRSLEEEADAERRSQFAHASLGRHFPSALNITKPSLPFWHDEEKTQNTPRIEQRPPEREDRQPLPPPHFRSDDPPNTVGGGSQRRHRRRPSLDATLRNDSLSSDQSEKPPRPRPRKGGNGHHRPRHSGSSGSEDDARSTPSSCPDSESDRVSTRRERSSAYPSDPWWRSQEDYRQNTSQDQQQHTVHWQRSKEGGYMGYLVLRKKLLPDGTRQSLGMRVVGGRTIDDSGVIGAKVDNIRAGTLADRIGRIEPGDEVVEWNGRRFRGLCREEVASIIHSSKKDPQVQLLVARPYTGNPPSELNDPRRIPPHLEVHPESMPRGMLQDPRYMRYSDCFTNYQQTPRLHGSSTRGELQVRLWYDPGALQLVVTVEQAKIHSKRPDNKPRNPYVKIVLLPDISEKSKRRSKTIARTQEPRWKQSFFYTQLRQSELRSRTLQIGIWDYDREYAYSDFLGEVLIPLRGPLTGQSRWYPLCMHQEEKAHSPTPSRIPSDDDLSDYDDKFSQHTERRIMAVDSSPPFYHEGEVRRPHMTTPLVERAYSSPSVEWAGFEDRRQSRSMVSRRTPNHGSRSASPPHYRPQVQPTMRMSSSTQRLQPHPFRKRQLPQVPPFGGSRDSLEERIIRSRNNSLVGTPSGIIGSEWGGARRGGGSRMAAALGVGGPTPSPLVSPAGSDSETGSKFNLSSAFQRNIRTLGEFTGSRSSAYGGPVHPSSRGDMDGSLSDTAVGLATESKASSLSAHRRSTDLAARSPYLSKKSNSTSQLSVTGHKKRLIFRRRNGSSSSFVVQRSEEILPDIRAASSISSDGSVSGESFTWGSRVGLPPEAVGEAASFVEGLGPGQLVGRQALASPSLGEVQLGIYERKNCLEVEVIRARGLMPKPNAKVLPAPYVKVYLMDGRKCVAKRKTETVRRTLDPLYQQQLLFPDDFRHCFLQVTVWGNYSSMERKVFMGVAQIVLDDIDLAKGVINWYKLFHHSSLVSSLAANDRSSFLSLDSFG